MSDQEVEESGRKKRDFSTFEGIAEVLSFFHIFAFFFLSD